jgi:hypothetical protein
MLFLTGLLWGCTPGQGAAELPFGGRPDYEKLDLTIPSDEQQQKEFAYQLYTLANRNYKNLEKASYIVKSVTTTMNIPVLGYRYVVKDKDRYLYLEYSFVEDEGGGILLGLFAKDSTQFALRRYTDKNMTGMYEEKTLSPTYTVVEGENVYQANWNKLYSSRTVDKPVYYAEQTEEYEYTDQKITVDTIRTVRIEYHEEEGYYRIILELDVENPLTTAKTLPNLRANSGSSNAHYTGMTQTIEIWDNGYFKYFLAEDRWEGQMDSMPLSLTSDIHFETQFVYNEEYLDFGHYQYAEELIEKCNGETSVTDETSDSHDAALFVYCTMGFFGLCILIAAIISINIYKKNRRSL